VPPRRLGLYAKLRATQLNSSYCGMANHIRLAPKQYMRTKPNVQPNLGILGLRRQCLLLSSRMTINYKFGGFDTGRSDYASST
jgi:hypothetical protein